MMNALRRRSLALAALLFLLGMVSAELCLHDAHAGPPPGATVALACGSCSDCDGPAADASHGHDCLCACHTLGVLVGLGEPVDAPAPGALAPPPAAFWPADFRSRLERPPLTA